MDNDGRSDKGSYSGKYDRMMNEFTMISGFIERQKQKGYLTTHFTKDSWSGNNYTRFQGRDGMGDIDGGVEFIDYRSKIPVFIVGSARSGTTLLEKLLVSHSDPMGVSKQLVWGMGEDTPLTFEMHAMHEEVMHVYKEMDMKKTMLLEQIKGVEEVDDKLRLISDIDKLEADFIIAHRDIVNKRAEIVIRKLLNNYHQRHRNDSRVEHSRGYQRIKSQDYKDDDVRGSSSSRSRRGRGGSVLSKMKTIRFVDKMVGNYFNIGLIHLVFPNAIIINMVRDPLDTLYSCYTTRFGVDSMKYTLYYKAMVHHYVQYLEIIQHFRAVLPYYSLRVLNDCRSYISCEDRDSSAEVVVGSKDVGNKRKRSWSVINTQGLIDVRYEELVAAPDAVMRRLRSIIGLRVIRPKMNQCQKNSATNDSTINNMDSIHSHDDTATTVSSSLQKQVHVVLTASKLQVKQPIYSHSIGRWKRHAKQLMKNIIPELLHYLPHLASINALPYIEPCLSRYLQTIYKQDFYRELYIVHDHYNFTYYRLKNISLSQLQYQYFALCSTTSISSYNNSIYNNSYLNWMLLDQHTYHFNL